MDIWIYDYLINCEFRYIYGWKRLDSPWPGTTTVTIQSPTLDSTEEQATYSDADEIVNDEDNYPILSNAHQSYSDADGVFFLLWFSASNGYWFLLKLFLR